ncbi:GNAT family N-acetyltransferase [Gorillibacterium massiliense]|uniref:GNAT family N-acetyltransferase n=1 Tax=Gorillibacterium massiliense TaxID=1280390 RepID=UPI0004B3A74E|nr:GNAT family N-acetyltransferase [Gorillibacterium massiliense]
MDFASLHEGYTEEAVRLALAACGAERRHVAALDERADARDYREALTRGIRELFIHGTGVGAFEGGRMVGYLGFWSGLNGQFGEVVGSYSPLHGNAFAGEPEKLASRLFQLAAEEMAGQGIGSYALTVYAHEAEVTRALALNGFGIRCADAIRLVDTPLSLLPQADDRWLFAELAPADAAEILPLKNKLIQHLRRSPVFFACEEEQEADFLDLCRKRQSRFFVARKAGTDAISGYMELTANGENFLTEAPDMMNICGAYLEESERGGGVFTGLLAHVLTTLKSEGVKRLGVDCETLNPTARYFWGKHFVDYTYSFCRRIDERAMRYL